MIGAFHPHMRDGAGDVCRRFLQFVRCAELVLRATDEQAGDGDVREMLGAKPIGFSGWMQRVADQHECRGGEAFGNGDRTHTASHRSPSQHHPIRIDVASFGEGSDGLHQVRRQHRLTIRKLPTRSTIRKIVSIHCPAALTEQLIDHDQ
jgi:hypothetical protein